MTGYQEVLTDPSYKGQLVCMTYPEIGNVGVNAEDAESRRVYVEGFIVREYWERPSNWRSEMPLGKYLEEAGVVGIEGIDTRALVRHLRTHGAQEAVISSIDLDPESLVRKAKASPGLVGRDLVKEVTCAEAYDWDFGDWELGRGHVRSSVARRVRDAPMVVALDYGIKLNILRRLVATGFRVKVMPAASTAAEILATILMEFFCRTGLAIPPRCRTLTEPSRASWERSRYSVSALGINCWDSRSAARPTSSTSGIMARTIR